MGNWDSGQHLQPRSLYFAKKLCYSGLQILESTMARSGWPTIAEGSRAPAISKQTEVPALKIAHCTLFVFRKNRDTIFCKSDSAILSHRAGCLHLQISELLTSPYVPQDYVRMN